MASHAASFYDQYGEFMVADYLSQKLKRISVFRVGNTLIMDNASFHSKKKVEDIAGSFGHMVIFIPPY